MAKHTPGPWHWVDDVTDIPTHDVESRNLMGLSLRTVAEHKTQVGGQLPEFILGIDQLYEPNANANARLIAAAPDLLEALKAMDRHIMDLALYIDLENQGAALGEPDSIRTLQEAAIAKAEEVQG